MVLLNDALLDLVKARAVDPADAYRAAADKTGLATQLRNLGINISVEASA